MFCEFIEYVSENVYGFLRIPWFYNIQYSYSINIFCDYCVMGMVISVGMGKMMRKQSSREEWVAKKLCACLTWTQHPTEKNNERDCKTLFPMWQVQLPDVYTFSNTPECEANDGVYKFSDRMEK